MKAKDLGRLGRGNDSLVAHINPFEALLLSAQGGSGTINPGTGLLEFDNGADGQGDKGSEGDQGPGGSSGPGGQGVGPGGHGAGDSPGTAGGGTGIGGDTSFSFDNPAQWSNTETEIGIGTGPADLSGYSMVDTFTATQDQMNALAGAAGLAERTALANNQFDPSHPAVERGRAIDAGTKTAMSFIDRLAQQFNPMRTYDALFTEKPPDAVEVANQVVSQISGPVGLAMNVGRALSEYALDQGWSIGYGYESVMSGGDNSERAQDLRRQINEAAGIPNPTATPRTTPVPEIQVVTQVPGYRSLLGGGYDGFNFLAQASGPGINRSTRRFA